MVTERSAGIVLFRATRGTPKYLLLHYHSGHWNFPKGNVEKREKLEETAKREIKEETGIEEIEFIPGFKETIKYFYRLKGKSIFKIVIFYLAETKTKKVKISWEHKGFKWLSYERALKQITFENAKEILKKAHHFLENHASTS